MFNLINYVCKYFFLLNCMKIPRSSVHCHMPFLPHDFFFTHCNITWTFFLSLYIFILFPYLVGVVWLFLWRHFCRFAVQIVGFVVLFLSFILMAFFVRFYFPLWCFRFICREGLGDGGPKRTHLLSRFSIYLSV